MKNRVKPVHSCACLCAEYEGSRQLSSEELPLEKCVSLLLLRKSIGGAFG